MNNAIIHCTNLTKIYQDGELHVPVFQDIELSIHAGETIAIIGASGSGKSTLLQLLGGLDTPTSGKVSVVGKEIQALTEAEKCSLRNHHLGFIYQFHHLLPEFNAFENVCMPLWIRKMPQKIINEKVKSMMEKVGLSHRLTHRVGELSGGERQRVAIARALVHQPACVLADEPTGNLDHHTADIIFELMLQLNQAHHTSFVIVTHNEALAKRCHRVFNLKNGQLIAC